MIRNMNLSFQEQIIHRLRPLYDSFGYRHYKMSKFEEYDLYARNKDFLISDSVLTFMDVGGRLMALKPDVTLSIVKNTRDGSGIQKLYYDENVYRVTSGAQGFRELMQVGLEALGDIDDYCQWEVLTLAAESLRSISPEGVLDISHLGLLEQLLEDTGISAGCRDSALRFVAEKNIHELALLCRGFGIPEERISLLRQAMECCGAPEAVLPRLHALLSGTADTAPVEELMRITGALSPEIRAMIRFDLSAVDDVRYYNGLLFKGYVPGVPQRVLSGGRYDRLMAKMGRASGAVGFAVYMDALERLGKRGKEYDADDLLLYDGSASLARLAQQIQELRDQGRSVLVQRTVPEHIRVRRILKLTGEEVIEV